MQTIDLDRLYQVIDSIDLEAFKSMLAIRSHEDDRRGVLQTLQSIGELDTRDLGHAHVEKQHIDGIALHFFDSLAHACRLGQDFNPADFPQKVAQLRASGGFVVYDNCIKQNILHHP